MSNYEQHSKQVSHLLPSERMFFNYGNDNTISAFNSFFSGTASGDIIVPDNKLVLNNDSSKILFGADFTGGFDTYYDWTLAFNGAIPPPERNTSESSGNDSIGPYDALAGTLPITIDCAGAAGTIYDLYSNNFLKISDSGRVFTELGAVLENQTTTTNTTLFALKIMGETPVQQANWNIDTFTLGGLNPSGKGLDFTKVQALVIEFYNKTHGDIRCGFLIDNTIYYAHIFEVNNNMSSLLAGDLNLPVRDTIHRTATDVTREIGVMTDTKGIAFVSTMDTTNDPALIATYFLNSCVAYAVGSQLKDRRKKFSHGYEEASSEYKTVSNPNNFEALFAIRPKGVISPGVVNRTIFGIDSISLYTRSLNLDDAAIFQIFWGTVAVGVYTSLQGSYSAMEFSNSFSINNTFALKIYSKVVSGNQTVNLKKEDILNDYYNNFSIKNINYAGVGNLIDLTRGTLFIQVKPTAGTSPIEVGASISGFEIA